MAKNSKRLEAIREKIGDRHDPRPIDEVLALLKDVATAKFDESVEAAINLGIDARKSDQNVRGSTVLPHGTGKSMRVAVFAEGSDADAGREAGADLVGLDDLAEEIKKGNIEFDIAIATPASMRVVGQLGKILGPRGLMPNPKVGTVTTDVAAAVSNAKAGQVQFRTDKAGIVHCPIGKASFTSDDLKANLNAILADLHKARPSSAKGIYLKSISLSTTMGPGLAVDKASCDAA
ncbi:MAG: 50S ribosomal protein L1 [Gammaproteobacteria bacterium]|nr:50S ribosomal protein L1 [Gammaproteobacteria bacterium]